MNIKQLQKDFILDLEDLTKMGTCYMCSNWDYAELKKLFNDFFIASHGSNKTTVALSNEDIAKVKQWQQKYTLNSEDMQDYYNMLANSKCQQ